MNKNKILIVISSNLFIRNYILTDAFSKVEAEYDCHYVSNINNTILSKLKNKKGFQGFYKIDDMIQKRHQRIFDVLMWTNRKKSSSFSFRIMRATPSFLKVLIGPTNRAHLRFFKWLVFKPYILLQRIFLNIRPLYKWYINQLVKNVSPNEALRSVIYKNNYDLVIFPSSSYDVEGIDIVSICQEINTKSLFLIDNWDNLSSKSLMWKRPDYIGVWGEQSKRHAIEIQGFADKNIRLIGTPRFDNYFKDRETKIDNYFNCRYILFVGTALDFDEEAILLLIDKVIEKNKHEWGDIKIVYRPHPWRQNNCKVQSTYGKNILTDPQILAFNNDKSIEVQPELEYYSGLFNNAEYVMGGLTSMLIEGLIFGKRFLAFVHEDSRYITNMRNALKYFEHFKGLENLESMSFSYDEGDVEEKMLECWSKSNSMNFKEIDQERNWYLFEDGQSYNTRLLSYVDNILN